jgi:hypothetical protein
MGFFDEMGATDSEEVSGEVCTPDESIEKLFAELGEKKGRAISIREHVVAATGIVFDGEAVLTLEEDGRLLFSLYGVTREIPNTQDFVRALFLKLPSIVENAVTCTCRGISQGGVRYPDPIKALYFAYFLDMVLRPVESRVLYVSLIRALRDQHGLFVNFL